jgi:hypothetical protein
MTPDRRRTWGTILVWLGGAAVRASVEVERFTRNKKP